MLEDFIFFSFFWHSGQRPLNCSQWPVTLIPMAFPNVSKLVFSFQPIKIGAAAAFACKPADADGRACLEKLSGIDQDDGRGQPVSIPQAFQPSDRLSPGRYSAVTARAWSKISIGVSGRLLPAMISRITRPGVVIR